MFALFKQLYSITCVLAVIVYGFASFTPFIDPLHGWPFTILALGFPFICMAYCLLLLLSIFFSRKLFIGLFLFLFVGWKNISTVFAFHPAVIFMNEKCGDIRLLSWNVDEFLDCTIDHDTLGSKRRQMLSFIKEMNADILCFQDFTNFTGNNYRHNTDFIRDSLGYRYVYFPKDYTYDLIDTKQQYGVAIFSKLPILHSGQIDYWNYDREKFIYADILTKNKIVRIYTAHLMSMGIHTKFHERNNTQEDFLQSDTALFLHRSNLRTLKYFDRIHTDQAKCIKLSLDTTPTPFIFCADLNSVPSSFTYHTLHHHLQDAFLQNGFGFGKTYDSISPTLRIDVVFLNKQLQAVQHKTPHLHLSDHYPNITDITIK